MVRACRAVCEKRECFNHGDGLWERTVGAVDFGIVIEYHGFVGNVEFRDGRATVAQVELIAARKHMR